MTDYIQDTLNIIKEQFSEIVNTDSFYDKYKNSIEVTDEQLFAKKTKLTPNSIYIVVKFTAASVDFGQVILPVTINAVSEQNGLEICQKLLFDFASIYTQHTIPDENDYVKELWNSPTVLNNFNEINIGFRSFFFMTGTILIGKHSAPIDGMVYYIDGRVEEYQTDDEGNFIYDQKGNKISNIINLFETMITFADSFDAQPDSQGFYSTNAIAKSRIKTASYGFNMTCFKLNNEFMNKCRKIKRGQVESGKYTIDDKFLIGFKDKDETTLWIKEYSLVNYSLQQNKGDLPVVSLTFVR